MLTLNGSRRWHPWPLLQQAVEEERIDPVDVILTETLLGSVNADNFSEACAITHLALALRAGHLCIRMQGHQILPLPSLFWGDQSFRIEKAIHQGFDSLVDKVMQNQLFGLVVDDRSLYFQRYWHYESIFIDLLNKHLSLYPLLPVQEEVLKAAVKSYTSLLAEQVEAIQKIIHQTITVISGGPGTGKTFTAGCLIAALWNSLELDVRNRFQIALAAPTGKAASHLRQSIISFFSKELPSLAATTLHGLLEISSYSKEKTLRLPYDLILIDESSMIDIRLMVVLLQALKPGARLVLLGDHRQLPPVEPGAPFADMIAISQTKEQAVLRPTFLQKCLRAELKDIVSFADAINEGALDKVTEALKQGSSSVRGRNLASAADFEFAIEELASYFPSEDLEPNTLSLQSLKEFRILTPLRKGLWGVENLNKCLHQALSKRTSLQSTRAIPILLTANDHSLKLYNGEMGFLIQDEAFFPHLEGKWRRFPRAILPGYQIAYCLSVHKSQGSEFNRIIVLLPPGSEMLGRAVLYTAVTRARQALDLWYDPATLSKTLLQEPTRLSRAVLK